MGATLTKESCLKLKHGSWVPVLLQMHGLGMAHMLSFDLDSRPAYYLQTRLLGSCFEQDVALGPRLRLRMPSMFFDTYNTCSKGFETPLLTEMNFRILCKKN